MLSLETIIIIIAIAAVGYFLYTTLNDQRRAIKDVGENVINNVYDSGNNNNENILDKLNKMEINFHNSVNECRKSIKNVEESHNKIIEINKMNNQTVLSQMNLYNEEEIDGNNAVLYSIDPSQIKTKIFVNKQHAGAQDDDFYMSSHNTSIKNDNENETTISMSTTSSNKSSKSSKSQKSSSSRKSKKSSKSSKNDLD